MEAAGGLYFALARRYDAGAGRFVSEDSVRGSVTAPFTLNRYTYCWNQPTDYIDLNGRSPVLVAAAFLLVIAAVAVDASAIHSINMMEEHYGRNKNQKGG